MDIQVFPNAGSVAREAAALIAAQARIAIALRDSFIIAVSGGQTPWMMLRVLRVKSSLGRVHIVQVDERIAPAETPIETHAPA